MLKQYFAALQYIVIPMCIMLHHTNVNIETLIVLGTNSMLID